MNHISTLLALILTGEFAAWAQTNAPAATEKPAAAKIVFGSVVYDFGRSKSGDTVKHDFIFTNAGLATLEIADVKTSCGCTMAGTWDKKVEPGKTGRIPLQFNTTGFGGQVAKSATVTCNDPAQTNLFLQIKGTVWKPIDVTPAMAMFNVYSETPTNETKVVRIISNLEQPVALTDLQSSNPSFKTELKEVKPGKEFELLITVLPPFSAPAFFSTITFKSSSTNAPALSVSAYAMVQQPVTVSPPQVVLPSGPLKAPLNTAVLVRNNSTNAFQISDVRLDLPGVDVKVGQPQAGQLHSITLAFPAGFELPAGQKPELTMKSSHPKFPQINVPVVQNKNPTSPASGAPVVANANPLWTLSPISTSGRAAGPVVADGPFHSSRPGD